MNECNNLNKKENKNPNNKWDEKHTKTGKRKILKMI